MWRYVARDALEGVVLPKQSKPRRFVFTIEETAHSGGGQRTLSHVLLAHR